MNKKISSLLILLLCCTLFSGCGKKGDYVSKQEVNILFSLSNGKDNFISALATSAKKYADSNQIKLTVEDSHNNLEEQISQIKSAKQKGYNAIVCIPVNKDTSLQIITEANNLPIVFLNQSPAENLLVPDKYVYVGSDENAAGEYQAKYLANYFKGQSSIKAVLFQGEKKHAATIARTDAVKSGLMDAGIMVDYVFEDTAEWSRTKAANMFQIFLSTKRSFDCVISNNDEMAIGVMNACKSNGIDPSSFPIVGVDATKDGCSAIANGDMAFTVYQSTAGQAKASVDAAIVIASGNSISDIQYSDKSKRYIFVPFEPMDSGNVDKYLK